LKRSFEDNENTHVIKLTRNEALKKRCVNMYSFHRYAIKITGYTYICIVTLVLQLHCNVDCLTCTKTQF